jgi:type II secretory pathway component PulK
LIITILVTFALAAMAIALCRSMRVEAIAAANLAATVQADSVERGAEQYVLAMLEQEGQNISTVSEDQFAGVQVGDGYFWVLRPEYDDATLPLYGLVEEGAKLNINTANYDQLIALPGMTDDIAAAIIDWRDEDSNATAGGAESEYYLALPTPYYAKNGAFETVEELLLVRGMTRDYLYGTGTGIPLGTTVRTRSSASTGSGDPMLARGLYNLLTVYSAETNLSGSGQAMEDVTRRSRREQLRRLLREKLAKGRAEAIIQKIGTTDLDDQFHLYVLGQMKPEDLEAIEDSITCVRGNPVRGRINVRTAPREVLLTLPKLDSSDVDKIISARSSATKPDTLSWFAEALKQKAVGLGPVVTAKASQYSADILAVSGNGRSYRRVRVVINTRQTPQIVYRRDISDRGWPMDKQILETLRSGQALGRNGMSSSGLTAGMGSTR